jgi:hypothetical protein
MPAGLWWLNRHELSQVLVGTFVGAVVVKLLLGGNWREAVLMALGFALVMAGLRFVQADRPRSAVRVGRALVPMVPGFAVVYLSDKATLTAGELVWAVGGGLGAAAGLLLLRRLWPIRIGHESPGSPR